MSIVTKQFTFNPFQTNCFVFVDEGEAVIVDPSGSTSVEQERLLEFVAAEGVTVRHILLTHAHIDHVLGLAALCQALDMSFGIHRDDLQLLESARMQAEMFGVEFEEPPAPGFFLEEGDEILFGSSRWEILHTPGHSPGSVSFADRTRRFVVSGDVLFAGSIGRTDLWRASLPVLMSSIYQKLLPLGDDFRVLPGHGPETTIGSERHQNPFLTESFRYT